jgi:hypothetical protein
LLSVKYQDGGRVCLTARTKGPLQVAFDEEIEHELVYTTYISTFGISKIKNEARQKTLKIYMG